MKDKILPFYRLFYFSNGRYLTYLDGMLDGNGIIEGEAVDVGWIGTDEEARDE